MTEYRLVAEPRADLDFAVAFHWYEGEKPGLGLEFLDQLSAAYHRIVADPLKYQNAVYFAVESIEERILAARGLAAHEQLGLSIQLAADDRELPVLPAEPPGIVSVDPKDEETWLCCPLAIVPDPFAGVRGEAQISNGMLELALPLRILLQR